MKLIDFKEQIEQLNLNVLDFPTGYIVVTEDGDLDVATISNKYVGLYNIIEKAMIAIEPENQETVKELIKQFSFTIVENREDIVEDGMEPSEIRKVEEQSSPVDEMEADYNIEIDEEEYEKTSSDEEEVEQMDLRDDFQSAMDKQDIATDKREEGERKDMADKETFKKVNENYEGTKELMGDYFSKAYKELGIMSAVSEIYKKTYAVVGSANEMPEVLEEALLDLISYAMLTLEEIHEED